MNEEETRGKRYQTGYDDGLRAGEWAGQGDAKDALAEKDREIERLQAENDELRKDAAAVLVRELHVTDKGLDLIAQSPLARIILDFVHTILKDQAAANFVTMNLDVKGAGEIGQYYMTVGRRDGLSPAEKIKELEADRDRWKARAEKLVGIARRWMNETRYTGFDFDYEKGEEEIRAAPGG